MRWLASLLVMPVVLCCASAASAAVPADPDDDPPPLTQPMDDPDLDRDDPPPLTRDPDDDKAEPDERREALPDPEPFRDREVDEERPQDQRRAEDVGLGALAGELLEQQRQLKKMNAQLEALVAAVRQSNAAAPARSGSDPDHARISQSIERTLKALETADTRIRKLEDSVWLTRILGILGPVLALLIGLAF
jgi:uncharacterized coiled-coil protein SlyX